MDNIDNEPIGVQQAYTLTAARFGNSLDSCIGCRADRVQFFRAFYQEARTQVA